MAINNIGRVNSEKLTEEHNLVSSLGQESTAMNKRSLADFENHNVIGRIQAKYGINGSAPGGSKPHNKKPPPNGLRMLPPPGMKKTYSNTNGSLQDSYTLNSTYDKSSNIPYKKKLRNVDKLPSINDNNRILPKIKS